MSRYGLTSLENALVVAVEMMHQAVAMADCKTVGGGNRIADETLGVTDRRFHVLALGETSGHAGGRP